MYYVDEAHITYDGNEAPYHIISIAFCQYMKGSTNPLAKVIAKIVDNDKISLEGSCAQQLFCSLTNKETHLSMYFYPTRNRKMQMFLKTFKSCNHYSLALHT